MIERRRTEIFIVVSLFLHPIPKKVSLTKPNVFAYLVVVVIITGIRLFYILNISPAKRTHIRNRYYNTYAKYIYIYYARAKLETLKKRVRL